MHYLTNLALRIYLFKYLCIVDVFNSLKILINIDLQEGGKLIKPEKKQ